MSSSPPDLRTTDTRSTDTRSTDLASPSMSSIGGDIESAAPQDCDSDIHVPPPSSDVPGVDRRGDSSMTLATLANSSATSLASQQQQPSIRNLFEKVIPGIKGKKAEVFASKPKAVIKVWGLKNIDSSEDKYEAYMGQGIDFDGSASKGTAISYFWDFGDRESVSERNTSPSPTKHFDKVGEYTVKLTVKDGKGQHHTARNTIYVKEGGTCWQKLSRRNKITLAKASMVIGMVSTLFTILATTTGIFEGNNNATTKAVGDSCKRKDQCASQICWNMTCGCNERSHCDDNSQFCFISVDGVPQCSKSDAFAPLFEATLLNTQDVETAGTTQHVMATPQGANEVSMSDKCESQIKKVKDCYNTKQLTGNECTGLDFNDLHFAIHNDVYKNSCHDWAQKVCEVYKSERGCKPCTDQISNALLKCGSMDAFFGTHKCDLHGMCSSGVFTNAPTRVPTPGATLAPSSMPSPEPTTNKPSAQPSLDPTPAPEMCNGKEFVRGEEFCWINDKKESTLNCSEYFTKKEGSEKKRYEEKCRGDKEPDDNGRFVLGAMDCPVCIWGLPSKAPARSSPSNSPTVELTQSPTAKPTPAPTASPITGPTASPMAFNCGNQTYVPRVSFCKLKNENGIKVFMNCSFFKHKDEEKKKNRRNKHCANENPGSLECEKCSGYPKTQTK